MKRNDDTYNTACCRAAAALVAERSSERLHEILAAQGITYATERVATVATVKADGRASVGIWDPVRIDQEVWFVRRDTSDHRLWADIERIPPKRNGTRIVLLGESVARGYFYDPVVTFAKVLEARFRAYGADDVEVVDLARTDLRASPLVQLLHEVVALEPDAVVVFAGNNWRPEPDPTTLSERDLRLLIGAVTGPDAAGTVRKYAEHDVRGQARDVVHAASSMSEAAHVPVVFVVPEFNLADWRNEHATVVWMLSSQDLKAWHRLAADAQDALETGDLARAEWCARALIDLDRGTAPASHELLAACARRRGDHVLARSHAESARDACLASTLVRSPRCHRVARDVLQIEGPARGLTLVDLPAVFAEYSNGDLPGRRLFLDYCHLTLEGLGVAADATVAALLRTLHHDSGRRPPVPLEYPVDALTRAEALLLAAVHNANWGQPREIVRFFCREARRCSREVDALMAKFLDGLASKEPLMLCASLSDVAASRTAAGRYLLLPGTRYDPALNQPLLETIAEELETTNPDAGRRLHRALQREHGLKEGQVDLLRPAYARASYQDVIQEPEEKPAYVKARGRRSAFRFISTAGAHPILHVTLRVPAVVDGEECVTIRLNGEAVGDVPFAATWRDHRLRLPARLVVDGFNELNIEWPRREWTEQERVRDVAAHLELGRMVDPRPVFGELYRLVVSLGPRRRKSAASFVRMEENRQWKR